MPDTEMARSEELGLANHEVPTPDLPRDDNSVGVDVDAFNSLSELIGPLRQAEDFAAGWPEIYRREVFRIAASHLLGENASNGGRTADAPLKSMAPRKPSSETDFADPIGRLSSQLGVEVGDVERVIHFADDGSFQILPRIDGSNNRERQILYSLVFCYVQEMALGTRHVDVDELRKLCVDNGCYDAGNFSSNFKKAARDDLIREIDKGDRARKYMATKKGLETAATLLRHMLDT